MDPIQTLKTELDRRHQQTAEDALVHKFALSFNPFPRSGISDLNSSDELISRLSPIDPTISEEINRYILDSLFPENPMSPDDKYLSAVVRGDYGYGKTQMLLYIKVLLESFSSDKEHHKKPYVVYIQNPGGSLSDLVGTIISLIGEENFKKYLWTQVIEKVNKDHRFRDELGEKTKGGGTLFDQESDLNPFSPENTINYKKFIDTLYKLARNPKELNEIVKSYTLNVLNGIFDNLAVTNYFYEFLLETAGISKTWENLSSGPSKLLDKKEVNLIKAVIEVVKWQGYTDFYILVDEFEAISEGRLSRTDLDRYLSNLRTLIDRERNWCSVFAMTNPAFERIRTTQAPLAQRISSRTIVLEPLNLETAQKLVINYLNLARKSSRSLHPFDSEGVNALISITRGVHRLFLKGCYILIQRGSEVLKDGETIGPEFVRTYIEQEFE
jgi:hypothetical protein